MCFYNYQAKWIVDDYGLAELFPEEDEAILIQEVSECAGACFDFGPKDFKERQNQAAVAGEVVFILIDFRRQKRGKSTWHTRLFEDQTLTALEQETNEEVDSMTEEDFEAERASFEYRKEVTATCAKE